MTEKKEQSQKITYFTQSGLLPKILLDENDPLEGDFHGRAEVAYALGRGYRRVGDYHIVARLYSEYPQSFSEPSTYAEALANRINEKFSCAEVPVPVIPIIEGSDRVVRSKAVIEPIPSQTPCREASRTMMECQRWCLGLHYNMITQVDALADYLRSTSVVFDLLVAIEPRFIFDEFFSEYYFAKVALRDISEFFRQTYDEFFRHYMLTYPELLKSTDLNLTVPLAAKKTVKFPSPGLPIQCYPVRHVLLHLDAWRTAMGRMLSRTVRAIFAAHDDLKEVFEEADKLIARKKAWYEKHVDISDNMVYRANEISLLLSNPRAALTQEMKDDLRGHQAVDKELFDRKCEKCLPTEERKTEECVYIMKLFHLGETRFWCLPCMIRHFDDYVHQRVSELRDNSMPVSKPMPTDPSAFEECMQTQFERLSVVEETNVPIKPEYMDTDEVPETKNN
jgi:hypothetical protein